MRSVLGDPNDLSLVLLFPLSFAVALVLTARTGLLARLLGLAGAGMMIAAILATQSRGGLLGIVAVFGVFGARRIRSKAVLFGGGAVGLLGLSVVAGVGGRQSGGATEAGAIDESAMGRLEAWTAAWRMAVGRPLNGVGLDCYVANFYYYSDWWEGFAKAVHSTWFAVLAEGGFPGFVAFVMMCVRILRTAIVACNALGPAARGNQYEPAGYAMAQAVLSGMAGIIISGTFLTQAFTWPVYILLALAAALGPYAQAARTPERPLKASLSARTSGTPCEEGFAARESCCTCPPILSPAAPALSARISATCCWMQATAFGYWTTSRPGSKRSRHALRTRRRRCRRCGGGPACGTGLRGHLPPRCHRFRGKIQ